MWMGECGVSGWWVSGCESVSGWVGGGHVCGRGWVRVCVGECGGWMVEGWMVGGCGGG